MPGLSIQAQNCVSVPIIGICPKNSLGFLTVSFDPVFESFKASHINERRKKKSEFDIIGKAFKK